MILKITTDDITELQVDAYFNYRKRGAKIIQINPGRTNFDSIATLNIHAGADKVLTRVIK